MPSDETEAVQNPENEAVGSDSEGSTNTNTENEQDVTPEKEPKDEWVDLLGSGGLLKKIVAEGEADTRPQRLQKCLLNYTCCLEDDTVVETEEAFELTLGDCEVIQGLDVAIGLMNIGEKCRLKVVPRLAYGSIGLPPKIPEYATLTYDIELLSAEDDEELEELTISQRKLRGNKKRERGNWWYGRGEHTLAVQCYRRALDFLDEVEGGIKDPSKEDEISDAALQDLLEDRISVCNNMAAAQIKLELYDAALKSLQTVLRCQPNNVKALFRKAKILRAKNELPAALKCLQTASQIAPTNPEIQKEMSVVNLMLQKQKVTERELARRMFNGPKSSSKEENIQTGKSKIMNGQGTAKVKTSPGMNRLQIAEVKSSPEEENKQTGRSNIMNGQGTAKVKSSPKEENKQTGRNNIMNGQGTAKVKSSPGMNGLQIAEVKSSPEEENKQTGRSNAFMAAAAGVTVAIAMIAIAAFKKLR